MRSHNHSRAGRGGGGRLGFALGCICALGAFAILSAVASAAAPGPVSVTVSQVEYTSAHVSASTGLEVSDTYTYRFQYATAPDFSNAVTGLTGTATGGGVRGDLTGLQTSTTYYLRAVIENSEGSAEATTSFTTKAPARPKVDLLTVAAAYTEAKLIAKINPAGLATTYHFQYLDQAHFEAEGGFASAQTVTTPSKALTGTADPDITASQPISGLQPDTTYRYRVIAENSKGSVTAPERTFHTYKLFSGGPDSCPNAARREEQHSAYLPDCRAYELVSPAEKNGGYVFPVSSRIRAAASGEAVDFASTTGFGDVRGSGIAFEYLARRTAQPGTSGWATHAVGPRQQAGSIGDAVNSIDSYYADFTPSLSCGVYRSTFPLPGVAGSPIPDVNLYLRDDLLTGPGNFTLLSEASQPLPTELVDLYPAAISSDCSHVLFQTQIDLLPEASGTQEKLYEWSEGSLQLAGRIPAPGQTECEDGGAVPCEAAAASIAGLGARGAETPSMLSPDGSRVFFADPENGDVYMREGARTVQMNVSEKASPESPQPASLWVASADANRAFFTTSEGLLEGLGTLQNQTAYLYMYDAEAPAGERLTLISRDEEPADAGYVTGVIGVSANGDSVYFIAVGQLVHGEPTLTGEQGLYMWHAGEIRYIGPLANQGETRRNSLVVAGGDGPASRTSRVTADGRYLLFWVFEGNEMRGRGGFTGYDQGTTCTASGDGTPCLEEYLYDAQSGTIRCATCNPSGAPATSDALIGVQAENGALGHPPYPSHALSADGRYVFFSTGEALVPEDTNGRYDAYEYDTQTEEVHLLSSGTSATDSYFMDASPSGEDVFIVTRQRLLGWDGEAQYDLYDVRVNGGFPEPPPRSEICTSIESCHGASPTAPAPPPLGSHREGPGNPRIHRGCPKGKRALKRHGYTRCVPRHRKHGRRAANQRKAAR